MRFRKDRHARNLLRNANDLLTLVGYISYFVLLVVCLVHGFLGDWSQLLKVVLIPGISLGLVNVARNLINEPRPYETMKIQPLIGRDSNGKSMPSRHAFSMFIIAFSWFVPGYPVVAVILIVVGAVLAVIRVLGGVHYPRDVVAGALAALACALIGYVLI